MAYESPLGALSRLSAESLGVFRGRAAVQVRVSRKQLAALQAAGVIERVLPDTYRITAVARIERTGPARGAPLGGRRCGGSWAVSRRVVPTRRREAVKAGDRLPVSNRTRCAEVIVHRADKHTTLMVRGLRVTGIEPTLVSLAAVLDGEALEIACEDARRRRLTSVPALNAYIDRYGGSGRAGVSAIRRLSGQLDPVHAARSTLEVKARRLLVANGITDFVREFPLEWNGRRYRYDFAFERQRTILETNGRRWHDDPVDYEHDNEKWSVPGRRGYKIVFATWDKVTREPAQLLRELAATMISG